MLDMSELMEKQETKRKCTLLKSLKIALESLMFERSSAFFSTVTQSSGTLTMFCRHIVDCLLDGARLARADVVDDSPRVFWSLCVHLLDSPDSPVRNQFESARESSTSSSSSSASSHYSMLTDWIFYSLRHHCLLVQLEYLLAPANRPALASHFTPSAFLLDDLFVHDFLLYIKAFEKNNYAVLSKIKKTLFHLNQQIEECDAYLNKCQSPIGDGTSVVVSRNESCQDLSSSVSTGPISSSLTSPRSRLIVQQHRRMHSFPNIQINLAKKTEAATAAKQPLDNTTNKPIKTTSQNSIAATSQNSVIPTLALNDHEISYSRIDSFDSTSIHSLTSTTATNKREDIYSASNIFDLIHGVQINCEVSPLDKENSHFVIADLAIAAVEMIKTSSCFRPSKPPPASKYLSSSSIRINSSSSSTISPPRRTPAAILENIDSLDDFSYTGSPPSILPVSSSRLAKAVVTRRTKSLDLVDLDRVKRGDKKPRRCRSVNSIDSSRATTIVAVRNGPMVSKPGATANFSLFENSLDSFSLTTSEVSSSFTSGSPFGQTATSKLLKFSSPPRQDQSKQSVPEKPLLSKASKPVSLSRSRTDPLFTNDSGDDLDDLIKRPSANNSQHNDHNHMETINETESKSVGKPSLVRLESQRSRRFSWEEIEDLFSAENIAKELLKKCLKRLSKQKHNQSTNNRVSRLSKQLDESGLVPTVLDMEFFIKFMEYYEFLQSYYESKAFARARRFVFGSPAAAAADSEKSGGARSGNMTAMSASTIFWSHSSPANATVLVNDLSVSPASSLSDADRGGVGGGISALFNRNKSTVVSTLGSSSLKVKSAAYLLGNQNFHDQFEKQNNNFLSQKGAETTLTDTTTTSATTDQQSRSNLNLMMSSMNSNASFNSSISSAGTLIGTSNPSSSSHSGAARIIGDELWAPVREQLILNLHAKHKRAEQMQAQHYRCADCGIQVPYDKIKSFLYCEYFGKYFCRCCHVSQQSYIPAYVIYLSDYRTTFEVSKKAKNFLEKIYNEPLITLESLNPNLFRDESSVFVKMKKLRTKLYNSRSYLNSCRFSAELKAALETQFDDFIINDQHVYSIQSLFKLRKSNYFDQFRSLVNRVMEHIKSCELCSQQGYICGVCNRPDLLYPFDFESVEKCPNCLACYHRTCFKSPETCPRCLRKKLRASKQSS